jgi:hypothetical protein
MKHLLAALLIVELLGGLLNQSVCFAGSGKEFTTSVIYGTLAGTLVGAATLAFTSNPGDNLNNVARGASYGLYAGILLGIYVTYGVGDGTATQQPATETIQPDQNIYEGTPPPPAPDENKPPQGSRQGFQPTLAVFPVIPSNPSHFNEWGIGATLLNYQF